MDKVRLANELIRTLEKEKGVPVQITADTPTSVKYVDGSRYGREYFGSFINRPLTVTRVKGLDSKYEHDVRLLEGTYASLKELSGKIERLNVLYGYDSKRKAFKKAYYSLLIDVSKGLLQTARELPGKKLLMPLADNFSQEELEKVNRILDQKAIPHLYYRITATPDGVYHDRTLPGTLSIVDETKIANITLALFK